MATSYEKQLLINGIDNMFLQFMKTEETPLKLPEYEDKVYETASIDKVSATAEVAEKKIFLSNKLHSNPKKTTSFSIQVDAGYLPYGFVEEATGAVKLAEGVYTYVDKVANKYFRMAFPLTDEAGGKVIVNFHKCSLKPVGLTGETSKEDTNEQITTFEITAFPLAMDDPNLAGLYSKADLRVAKGLDARKLLEKGFIKPEDIQGAKVAGSDPSSATSESH